MFSGMSAPERLARNISALAPATIACASRCGSSRGLCQKSRPSACPNRNALYPAAAAPVIAHNASNHGGPVVIHHSDTAPPNTIKMYPPQTSQEVQLGVSNKRQNRSGRLRSQTSSASVTPRKNKLRKGAPATRRNASPLPINTDIAPTIATPAEMDLVHR